MWTILAHRADREIVAFRGAAGQASAREEERASTVILDARDAFARLRL